jgi:hypothetical protein
MVKTSVSMTVCDRRGWRASLAQTISNAEHWFLPVAAGNSLRRQEQIGLPRTWKTPPRRPI